MPEAIDTVKRAQGPIERVFPPMVDLVDPSDRLPLTPIIFGAATFGFAYNQPELFESDVPEQTLLTALRSGINAIDTSPFYGPSEDILGSILSKPYVRSEFPRSSYHLLTKCGRYGTKAEDFDYSRQRVTRSVAESCTKLGTDYLDAVYLHDVEFVASDVGSASFGGDDLSVIESGSHSDLARWGLAEGQEAIVWGKGDERVLEGVGALFEMQKAGKVRKVGISGYPLPTLLRLARLVRHRFGRPLDILMSYSHHTLQNASLASYLPHLLSASPSSGAAVAQVVNASPISMGLLKSSGPPVWHPAPPALRRACVKAAEELESQGKKLEDVALGFGLASPGGWTSTAVGFSHPDEVEACVRIHQDLVLGATALAGPDAASSSADSSPARSLASSPTPSSAPLSSCSSASSSTSDIISAPNLLTPLSKLSHHQKTGRAGATTTATTATGTATDKARRSLARAQEQWEDERMVIAILKESGYHGWSWRSPPAPKSERVS